MPDFNFKPKTLLGFPVPDWGNPKAVSSVDMLKVGNRVVAFLVDNNEDLTVPRYPQSPRASHFEVSWTQPLQRTYRGTSLKRNSTPP